MERITWFFYNIFFAVGYFLVLPRFLVRMWRRGGYWPAFGQRFGLYSDAILAKLSAAPGRIMIHAVSVGEIQVAFRFMAELRVKRPGSAFVLTTTTSTAHALAEKQMSGGDVLLYFPADFPFIVRRVLRQISPVGLILVESELWPNLVRLSSAGGIPVMLLNGRISNRSFRRYSFPVVRPLVRRVLGYFNLLCAQSGEDGRRLIALGADPARVKITGSAKYDIAGSSLGSAEKDENFIMRLHALGFGSPNLILVGGSTWPGEEAALLEAFVELRRQYPDLRLALVPRHAERRKQVMAEISKSGLDCRLWTECRQPGAAGNQPPVLLVDTTGELKAFYALADVVFIGKSLAAKGGQNPIEAAVFSKPIIFGPHMENFTAVVGDFLEAGAAVQVADKSAMGKAIAGLLADRTGREAMGGKARRVVLEKSGAIGQSADLFLNVFRN